MPIEAKVLLKVSDRVQLSMLGVGPPAHNHIRGNTKCTRQAVGALDGVPICAHACWHAWPEIKTDGGADLNPLRPDRCRTDALVTDRHRYCGQRHGRRLVVVAVVVAVVVVAVL